MRFAKRGNGLCRQFGIDAEFFGHIGHGRVVANLAEDAVEKAHCANLLKKGWRTMAAGAPTIKPPVRVAAAGGLLSNWCAR